MSRAWKILIAVVALATATNAGAAWARSSAPTGAPFPDYPLLSGGETTNGFVAQTPCRIVDTRKAGGKLALGGARVFDVRGSGATFAFQGGKADGCDIPESAVAIEATVTAIEANSGFLRLWPGGASQPNATFLNFDDAFNVSNSGTVALCGAEGEACTPNWDLSARAYGNQTHLVVEVQGYYEAPLAGTVQFDSTVIRGSRIVDVDVVGTGQAEVQFDQPVSQCIYQVTLQGSDGYGRATGSTTSEDKVFVATYDADGNASPRTFQLQVTC